MILATRTCYRRKCLAVWIYVSITFAFLGPLLFSKKIGRLTGRSRKNAVILISIYPLYCNAAYSNFIYTLKQVEQPFDFKPLQAVLFFGLIQIFGTWLSCTLQEFNLERIAMKEEIQRAEKLMTLGEVAASIAHEIRNPLTVVQGFLQLMSTTIVEGKNRTFLQFALEEVARAEAIIT